MDLKRLTLTKVAVKDSDFVSIGDYERKITSSKDAARIARELFGETIDIYESFYAVFLNRAYEVLSFAMISQGGVSGTVVDSKMLFKYAIDSLASGVIVFHNHPSGNLTPSQQDIRITSKLKEFGDMIDVPILDHLILTEDSYYSFADEGKIRS